MWIYRISLDLYGDDFSPREFIKDITDSFIVFNSNEPDDKNDKDPNGIYGFGSISILSPHRYGLQYETEEYEKWYFDFIDKYEYEIKKHNVSEINFFIDIFHSNGQLNTEIFSRDKLKKIAKYDIAIPFSYYKITKEQIIDMLNETDYSKDKLDMYINND